MRSASQVAGGVATDRGADRLDSAIDYPLLVSVGWDLTTQTFTPDRDHPLLGYPVCLVLGCELEAWDAGGLCTSCRDLFRASGADCDAFCAAGASRKNRSRDRRCLVCRVVGFERPVGTNDLCLSCDGLRRRRHQSVGGHVDGDGNYPAAAPRPSLGTCTVASCQRLAAHPQTGLCGAHDGAWRLAGHPQLGAFCRATAPCQGDRSGRVVLAGLDEEVIAEVLYGVQAALAEGRRVMPTILRQVIAHLRRYEVNSVAAAVDTAPARTPVRWFLAFAADRVGLVRASLETEQPKDVWDLRLWGATGRLSFIGGGTSNRRADGEPSRPISQSWLRAAAKAWAADALTCMTTGPVRAVIGAVGLFSEHLSRRPDAGTDPATLGHADMQAFLARLAHLQRAGTLTEGVRVRSVNLLARFLRDCREMGLTQSGAVLAALPADVVIRQAERPRERRRDDEVGLALPEVVMSQLLAPDSLGALERLAGRTVTAAVELSAGVGRRTAELCGLHFSCLDYDEHIGDDGQRRASPVLVHDMPKVNKTGCRLPIHDREAVLITAQQTWVRTAFPDTPIDRLMLFPRPLTNPDGTKPIGTAQLQRMMRAWVTALPALDGTERGTDGQRLPFPRERVFPYAFRHTFAQRHADAGTPVDTLKELLGHDTVRTTLGYYRVTTKRKRDAQDRLGPLQIDARGNQVRPGLTTLTDTEAAREQVGQVAVPFGICTEPTNVAAGGHSCPFRHRCTGCEYFRTDPSYTPELRGYLNQLLADRERLATAIPALTDWARCDAAPSEEEIDAVRRLLRANDEVLTGLDDDDRAAVEGAIATIRTQRSQLQVSFPAELTGVVRQHQPVFFPTIELSVRTVTDRG